MGSSADIDTDPLVLTLYKVSGGRLLREGQRDKEDEVSTLQIPVIEPNPGDKADRALRRYAQQWLRKRVKNAQISCSYKTLAPGTSYFLSTGIEVPVQGVLVLTWRVRRALTGMEELKAQQEKWKGTRPSTRATEEGLPRRSTSS
jgi:hypothetical protein